MKHHERTQFFRRILQANQYKKQKKMFENSMFSLFNLSLRINTHVRSKGSGVH